ncbi:MAG: hypothetical protein MJZ04_00520 [Bacteroidales bacterium]|nr:hypothetical protein [Bacteroidales bacterium]
MNKQLLPGLSGFVRARNEGRFLGPCIDSCINALDELIVVYNDCTDNTEEVLKSKQAQYPGKIKIYNYGHKVMVDHLSKEDFEYVKALPDDDPRLFATQCNYALDQISYEFAIKIDPDQVYFEDSLQQFREVCRKKRTYKWNPPIIIGWLFRAYVSFYRRVSAMIGKPCTGLLASWIKSLCFNSFSYYCYYCLQQKQTAISFSGVNVFYDGEWTIPFDGINIHPPYNGEGDLLLFPVSKDNRFVRRPVDKDPYSVWEAFQHSCKIITWVHPIWFHFHANRPYCYDKVWESKKNHPDWFIQPQIFCRMKYKEVHNILNKVSHSLYQRTLWGIIHIFGVKTTLSHLYLLDKLMPEYFKQQKHD